MVDGRSRLYADGVVAECGDVAAAPVSFPGSSAALTIQEARQEIDTLRLINAQLVQQISRLVEREAQAQKLADRDGLTGLYNRRKVLDLLQNSISAANQSGRCVALLFIDLNGFKGVNDRHGHAAGDELLTKVASRIAGRARAGDFVCRYGGDEFVVILSRVADLAAARQVAESIASRVAMPYRIDGAHVYLSAAVGVSIHPDEADSAASLIRRADESMYRAKARWQGTRESWPHWPAPARRRDDRFEGRWG
jgi:diguanylate cyclase (GGDEF)-like protein